MRPPPYLGPQKDRWVGAGFDLDAARVRHRAFKEELRTVVTSDEAADLIERYADQERRISLSQGVPVDDGDLWRIESMRKHIEWR